MANDGNTIILHDTSTVSRREQLRLLRAQLAEAAQKLIDAIDDIDGDPDYEDDGSLEEEPDREPDYISDNGECGDAPFALNQEGTNWAYGDDRPNAETNMRPAEAGTPLHILEKLRNDLERIAGKKSEVTNFQWDGNGTASFMKDGERWMGGRL